MIRIRTRSGRRSRPVSGLLALVLAAAGVVAISAPEQAEAAFSAKVNFQPASAAVPAGYVADGGLAYGSRGNGLTYGWSAHNTGGARDRGSAAAPDQRYDTLNHMQLYGPYSWEIAVPDGTYQVRVVAGDPDWFNSVYQIDVEGILTVNGTPSAAAPWVEGTQMVTVTDGKLTVSSGSGASNNKISFVEINAEETPAPSSGLAAAPTSLAFGPVLVGSTKTLSTTLTNHGSAGDPDITISMASFTGVDAARFSTTFTGPVSLAPGASTPVPVTFAPDATGSRTAQLVVTHSGTASPLTVPLSGSGSSPAPAPVGFGKSALAGETSSAPTTLQWGPDGRLYTGQFSGLLKAYTVKRNGANAYQVTATETIDLVQKIPNHNDDGVLNTSVTTRIVTGILVTGTAANPVIYVTSSDPRIGGGSSGEDKNLDTNSSMVSRLTKSGSGWTKLDLVRGLPRSEENHSANGMVLSPDGKTLYLAQGGNTNQGAPSNNFALLPEFALSAAILKIDLAAIGNTTYDLPTLDDSARAGAVDAGDPFGGNDGKNQAKLVPGGPVQIHAPGFRNPYDVIITEAGKMYSIDNGSNAGWGKTPVGEGTSTCTNAVNEPGATTPDGLHLITGTGYYAGHANPTRGNKANTFSSPAQSPVSVSNSVECDYRAAGFNGSLTTFPGSTNGLFEYTASNFGGAMTNDLIATDWSFNKLYRMQMNDTGTAVVAKSDLFSSIGAHPLDVVAMDDDDAFPGTIWIADQGNGAIYVFEPNDFGGGGTSCTGADSTTLDEDGDGFKNADEIDNGTNPCSSGDKPADADGDKVSDLNDPDDDNDGLSDTTDPFAVDSGNGAGRAIPVRFGWDNGEPDPGGLLGLGFTGVMSNGVTNYRNLYDPAKMTAGGAAGVTTVDEVHPGDALGATNTGHYGFQFGVNASAATGVFTAHTRILAPFTGVTPAGSQSMGLQVGTGGQDDYLSLVTTANNGSPGVRFTKEAGGAATHSLAAVTLPGPDAVDLYLTIDPAAATVQPSYTVTTAGVIGPLKPIGSAQPFPAAWLTGATKLAVGLISTSAGATTFAATWDFIEVTVGGPAAPPPPPSGSPVWKTLAPAGLSRQEVSYTQTGNKMYLGGGNSKAQEVYNPATNSWATVASLPSAVDHVQSVAVGGKVYYLGGLIGYGPSTTGSVHIYNPTTNTVSGGTPMPSTRQRGAGGVAVYGGKIYYAGGLHNGAAVNFFDVYDPVANTWTVLPNMPTARDHFAAAVVGNRFYAIGGRVTLPNSTVTVNQAFDFTTNSWVSGLAPLPTARGGFAVAAVDTEVFVIGGEGGGGTFNTVEAYKPATNSWRTLPAMPTARHGIQAAVCNGGIYIAGGATLQGAGSQTNKHEVLFPYGETTCGGSAPPPSGATLKVNFQPFSAAVPAGYLKDAGDAYASRGNGHTYGWNAHNANTRDRNSTKSPDQRYDTFNHMQANGTFTWDIAVANGAYTVRVVAGDPDWINSTYAVTAEGVPVASGTPTTANPWVDGTKTVTVSDGKLTIGNGAGAANNKLAFIEITPVA